MPGVTCFILLKLFVLKGIRCNSHENYNHAFLCQNFILVLHNFTFDNRDKKYLQGLQRILNRIKTPRSIPIKIGSGECAHRNSVTASGAN